MLPRIEVFEAAKRLGWTLEQEQTNPPLFIFVRAGVQVNVYHTTGTIGTALKHPKKGSTQLFRRGCRIGDLENIFRNPRIHTGRGYYETQELARRRR